MDELLDYATLLVMLGSQNGHVAPQRLVVDMDCAKDRLGRILTVANRLDVCEDRAYLVAESAVDNQVVSLRRSALRKFIKFRQ